MQSDLLKRKEELLSKFGEVIEIDVDGDETDEIQGNLILQFNQHMNNRNSNQLRQINDALNRLKENNYGLCQDCEEEISEKRLMANPCFLTCISCAEERELEIKRKSL